MKIKEQILEEFYNKVIKKSKEMPDFKDLSDKQKTYLEKSLAYTRFKIGKALQELLNTIKINLKRYF